MTTCHSLDCRLKLSLARGVTGGGVCWEDGDDGDTEKRLSLPMTLITWLFGLWGRRGLIYIGRLTDIVRMCHGPSCVTSKLLC